MCRPSSKRALREGGREGGEGSDLIAKLHSEHTNIFNLSSLPPFLPPFHLPLGVPHGFLVIRHGQAPREGGDKDLQRSADQLAGVLLVGLEEEEVDLQDERGQDLVHLEEGRREGGREGGREVEMLLLLLLLLQACREKWKREGGREGRLT